jgi:penicillin-binding protein 1A
MNYGKKGAQGKQLKITSRRTLIRKRFVVIFIKTMLIMSFAIVIASGCVGYGIYKGILDSAPSIDDIDPSPVGYLSTVLDNQGNEIDTLVASGANRVYATLDEIPQHVQNAFVAIEDARFYEHNGIDINGILRAGVKGVLSGSFSEGASTITQQLLKNNVFTGWTGEVNFLERMERKLQEQYLAVELSKVKSKEWVLENYLNTINLGQNTLGIQSASRRYFGKSVSDLTLSEAAVIASITQNPSRWNPITHPDSNKERQKVVLEYMKEQKFISQKEYDDALSDDVYSRIQKVNVEYVQANPNSYFVDALINQIVTDLVDIKGYTDTQAYKALYQSGLMIYSTQDPHIQSICDEEMNNPANYPEHVQHSFSYRLSVENKDGEIENYSEQSMLRYYQADNSEYSINFNSVKEARAAIRKYKKAIIGPNDKIVKNGESITFTLEPQAAITIMDQYTGEIKAIVGGRGEKNASRTLNRATNTIRQPGSLFKILSTFAPALDTAGMTLGTVQDDAPYEYENGTPLRNYDNSFRGFTTIREAITYSINIATVKTMTEISPQVGYDYLLNFGFTTLAESDVNQALSLGGITNGVSNLQLTAAFATIANNGTYTAPRFYTKILDHDGNVLIDNSPKTQTVLKDTTAFLLTDAMKDVVTIGSGTAVNFGTLPISGKTGTTTKNRDALFAGYTPYYTCVTWGGYDDNSPQTDTGYPKVLWRNIMARVHENLAAKDFTQPKGITTAAICRKSGKLAASGICDRDPRGSMVTTEFFTTDTMPTSHCDHHYSANVCTESGMLANEFCPDTADKVFIKDGSNGTDDSPYMLGRNEVCNIHSVDTLIPPNTMVPIIDTNGDGIPDAPTDDANGDGIPDTPTGDANGDGTTEAPPADANGDGVSDTPTNSNGGNTTTENGLGTRIDLPDSPDP